MRISDWSADGCSADLSSSASPNLIKSVNFLSSHVVRYHSLDRLDRSFPAVVTMTGWGCSGEYFQRIFNQRLKHGHERCGNGPIDRAMIEACGGGHHGRELHLAADTDRKSTRLNSSH